MVVTTMRTTRADAAVRAIRLTRTSLMIWLCLGLLPFAACSPTRRSGPAATPDARVDSHELGSDAQATDTAVSVGDVADSMTPEVGITPDVDVTLDGHADRGEGTVDSDAGKAPDVVSNDKEPGDAAAAGDVTDVADAPGGDADANVATDSDGAMDAAGTVPDSLPSDDADTSDADTSDADTSDADTSDADTSGADTSGAEVVTPADTVGSGDVASSGDAGKSSSPPWSADAWSGPVKPIAMATLPKAKFVDVTSTYGLDPKGSWAYCTAVGYVDADNHPDVVLIEFVASQSGPPDAVIRTLRTGPKPQVVTSSFNTSLLFPDGGCALADLSGDGFADLVVGGQSGLAYYLGNGQGKFIDVSAARLPQALKAKVFTIAVDDFDGDGRLDLYLGAGRQPDTCQGTVCGYTATDLICTFSQPMSFDNYDDDRLLLQQKDGSFVDKSAAWSPAKGGIATSVASRDLDGDGWPEVLVGDDFGGHFVLPNLGGKAFGKPVSSGFRPYAHAMGWGMGDLNGDGTIDLVVADVGPVNVYAGVPGSPLGPWLPLPTGHPLSAATWSTSSWVPLLGDLDHDGDLDIYLGVAMTEPKNLPLSLSSCTGSSKGRGGVDLLIRNDGGFHFTLARLPKSACGDAAAVAQSLVDFDGDGDLDIVQSRRGCQGGAGDLHLLRNDLVKSGASVVIRLIGGKGNHDAIGARLDTTIAGVKVSRTIVGSIGIGSSGARNVHLGLGSATGTGPISVTWPDGKKSQYSGLKAGMSVSWKAP